jgi:hypothetical protein
MIDHKSRPARANRELVSFSLGVLARVLSGVWRSRGQANSVVDCCRHFVDSRSTKEGQ